MVRQHSPSSTSPEESPPCCPQTLTQRFKMSLPGNKSLEEHDPVMFDLIEQVSRQAGGLGG